MKITCLVDDCAREGVGAEHGLSLWVEACGKKLLFDSGASGLFLENAARLGIDIAEADFAVLSHAHYDHGGGLAAFLQANSRAKVYVRAGAFAPRYARRRSGKTEYIGIDAALAGNGRVVETGETCTLAPGLTLFSGVRGRELFSGANRLLLGPDGETPGPAGRRDRRLPSRRARHLRRGRGPGGRRGRAPARPARHEVLHRPLHRPAILRAPRRKDGPAYFLSPRGRYGGNMKKSPRQTAGGAVLSDFRPGSRGSGGGCTRTSAGGPPGWGGCRPR